MRLRLACGHCITEALANATTTSFSSRLYSLTFNESGVYRFRCAFGHDEVTVLAQPAKFEILAETATQAILDGYYREAIASFAAALERFYEFYIEAISLERKVIASDYERVWRDVEQQSERQFGMYLGMFLRENGTPPPSLPGDFSKRRNRVIHKGKIPSEEEASKFGEDVLSNLCPVLIDMRTRYPDALRALYVKRHAEAGKHIHRDEIAAHFMSPMIIDRMTESGAIDRTFASELERRRRMSMDRSGSAGGL